MTNIKEMICSYGNLIKAFGKAKRNIMWKDSVISFNRNKLISCMKLRKSLLDGTYKIDDYVSFTIFEPKKRFIVSTRLKDRVFQRSMCDNYLYNEITRRFVYDNGACQIGKGTDFCRNRLTAHLQRFHRKHGMGGYALKCDVKDYFGSTRHDIAKSIMRRKIGDDWVYEKVAGIIDSFDGDKGIGLGSQVSQLIQLAVLDDMDHLIKERLGIKHYVRYMDDFILIHESKDHLKWAREEISKHLESICLSLNDRKTHIIRLADNICFLGFSYRLTETGKVIRRICKENLRRHRRKTKGLFRKVAEGRLTMEYVSECNRCWKAHASKGNTHNLILRLDKEIKERKKEHDRNKDRAGRQGSQSG